ncbi:hypothetical protein VTI74DRAFT_9299 [Chaetomium olivicolor]
MSVLLLRARLPPLRGLRRCEHVLWIGRGGDWGMASPSAVPVRARRLERRFGGRGAEGPVVGVGVIFPDAGIGDMETDELMASSMSEMGAADALLPPAPINPVPPRVPNIACAAQPALEEVGKEKRSGEARPFLPLTFTCDTELIGSRPSRLSGFRLSRSHVSALEVVESLRLVCLYDTGIPLQLLPSRPRPFVLSETERCGWACDAGTGVSTDLLSVV